MTTVTQKAPTDRYLGIYLNDHRAGAAAGLALAKRAQRENAGTPFGDALSTLVAAIEEDVAELERVARKLGVRADPVKLGIARAGEMASRLKPNGQLRGYSPLSRLLEIESLIAGIEAKRSLWRSLQFAERPELTEFDFRALEERAVRQRDQLAEHHRAAARLAFTETHDEPGEKREAETSSMPPPID
ncbi:MAG TPA: hypothetical protein VF183_00370 [Acidimicrobiales bacterium]